MADISVEKISENQAIKYKVTVSQGATQTQHLINLNKADYMRVTNRFITPEKLIEKSFEFLLENEPIESILSEFDFNDISRYFPYFKQDIQKRIGVK